MHQPVCSKLEILKCSENGINLKITHLKRINRLTLVEYISEWSHIYGFHPKYINDTEVKGDGEN